MFDPNTQQAHTAHTSDPVPLIYIGRKAHINHENGKLSDIAPTILTLLDLPIPPQMTGRSLIKLG
jgi:2,3-bisphosphoglycerate-independent phosphoglycerate mutase